MIEPVYVPYEQYRAAKTRCGLDSRIYGIAYAMVKAIYEVKYGKLNCKQKASVACNVNVLVPAAAWVVSTALLVAGVEEVKAPRGNHEYREDGRHSQEDVQPEV
jgi:hypothetical protein